MSHQIRFHNVENDWSNGLPLGNGVFGAMATFGEGLLAFPMNHYEVYYMTSKTSVIKDKIAALPAEIENPGQPRLEARARAEHNRPSHGEKSFWYYRGKRGAFTGGAGGNGSKSHPVTGEIAFALPKGVRRNDTDLVLDIERAEVSFAAKGFSVRTICAREDRLLCFVKQKKPVLTTIYLSVPQFRGQGAPDVTYFALDDTTFGYTVDMSAALERPFRFAVITRLIGATGSLQNGTLTVSAAGDYTVATGVFTAHRYENPAEDGAAAMRALDTDALEAAHRAYWDAFFDRAGITLPDPFIEKIWYVNQYAFDCSSGKDGVMYHQACGLNGLWDVKRPTLWGSRWYWDVNIQAAFAGVFSSNRLELGKVFCDGLRAYIPLAEHHAKRVHGIEGISIDYPFDFYHCCWPWCAAYVWDYYLYTEDKDFLKNEAYPLFLGLCRCATALFEWVEARGEYVIFPDISPEQGPLGANSVITVSSVKYMLKFTLEAAEILGDSDPLLEKVRHLLAHLPAYPTVTDKYGRRLLDSEEAPPDLGIRHPSMLMPVFPTGEIHRGSPKRDRDLISNTVTWLEDHCESGVFHVSWLAAACARMGEGQRAIRLLYEKGIDLILRTNGLAAEETDRFIHHSLVLRQPLYYPCMMEFTGEMLAAVNEMLLQSDNGMLRIFPALPDGDPEYERMWRHGYGLDEYKIRTRPYEAWRDVRFDKLLARGAFEVSAEMKGGRVLWISLFSKNGNSVRLTSPHSLAGLSVFENGKPVAFTRARGVLAFDTVAGATYVIARTADAVTPRPVYADDGILEHATNNKRRIYIGENPDAVYHQAVDNFTRPDIYGTELHTKRTCYKFDFTEEQRKRYFYGEFDTQAALSENPIYLARHFVREAKPIFSVEKGYGFAPADEGKLSYVKRDTPDLLRGDLLEGTEPVEFLIEVPRGGYDLLVCSGDAAEDSVTCLAVQNGRQTGGELTRAGEYQCKRLPVVQERDGKLLLRVSTKRGYKWKLNFIFVNKTSAFY